MEAGTNGMQANRRYLAAETALWGYYGLTPVSHTERVGSAGSAFGFRKVGTGDPILFVHGTGGSGAYFAPLVAELAGFRRLVIDRPGWGMSAPVDYSQRPYAEIVSEVLRDTLDALEVERAHRSLDR